MTKLNFINIIYIIILIIIIILISNYYLHPIIIISLILIYSRLICIIITLWSFNYIYSIIIFLIIIRGVLILFIYFTRLISNEQYKILLYKDILLIFFITSLIIYKSNLLFQSSQWSFNTIPQINLKNCPFQFLFKLYNYPDNYITFICILFLLISLFLIIKIRSIKSSSLRKIN